MKSREIKLKNQKYSIIIGHNVINQLPKKIKLLCPKVKNIALIIDKNVPQRLKKKIKIKLKNYKIIAIPYNANEKEISQNNQ